MLFTILAALAQMEHEIKSERITDSINKRKAAGKTEPVNQTLGNPASTHN